MTQEVRDLSRQLFVQMYCNSNIGKHNDGSIDHLDKQYVNLVLSCNILAEKVINILDKLE